MSAVGNRVCVGLLVYLALERKKSGGEWYHYQRSCPVGEVRVSQLDQEGDVFESGCSAVESADYECDLRGRGTQRAWGVDEGGGVATVPDSACSGARELARLTA
jgi:hypothetical protein